MYRSVFDPRNKLYVLFNFSVLKLSIQKQTANLYSDLLNNSSQDNQTKTIFIFDESKSCSIINDFNNLFYNEKINYVPSEKLEDLDVTGNKMI